MNEKFRGMTMIGDIIIGDPKDHQVTNKYVKRARNHEWTDIPPAITKNSLVQSCIASSFGEGIRTILQTAGVGAIKPNIALFNMKDYTDTTTMIALKSPSKPRSIESPNSFKTMKSAPTADSEDEAQGHNNPAAAPKGTLTVSSSINEDEVMMEVPEEMSVGNNPDFHAPDYIDGLQDALLTGMGVMLVAGQNYMDWTIKRNGFIDIWWLYDDGGLTVLIPYLLKSHSLWKDCKLRVMAITNLGISEQTELVALMSKLRIDAEVIEVKDNNNNYDGFGGKIEIKTENGTTKISGNANNGDTTPSGSRSRSSRGEKGGDAIAISPKNKSSSPRSKDGYQKTPQDDIEADFPLVEDDKKTQQDAMDDDDDDAIINNTLFETKLQKSSYVDNYHKSLRHEVFTYDHIDDLNPDKQDNEEHKTNGAHSHSNTKTNTNTNGVHISSEQRRMNRMKHEMNDMLNDNQISKYAKRKLKKYMKLGQLIERSRDSDLCIVTMPFPRAEYTSYEYMKILQSLTPNNMNNIIFVRGNQDQVLTYAL
eukprot:CAMPEP_0201595232 /NCGR_PEP_ID=MMETSP0190_2-20130828/192300_1 /ASSEMBLY_ACC=CAM_ASM_000263 /TAXON_ID=37353 /ORGANISM="Rosalina sp." /LENGTH=534 /DNA_ID=CAMNT_0048055141 /DNA_START=763 /DNA_END=2370 /DNA_ORIENTATION=-